MTKSMNTKPKLTNRALADIYDTSERQISRWRAEDAPLRDIAGMTLFFLVRKSYPRHLQHLSEARKAEMQRRLDAFEGGPAGPTWLDYIRSASEDLCNIDGDVRVLRDHPAAPAAVRAKAKELAGLLHGFNDAFHGGFAEAAGISEDEMISEDSFWKRERETVDDD